MFIPPNARMVRRLSRPGLPGQPPKQLPRQVAIAIVAAVVGLAGAITAIKGSSRDNPDVVPAMVIGAIAIATVIASVIAAIKRQAASETENDSTPTPPNRSAWDRTVFADAKAGHIPNEAENPDDDQTGTDMAEEQRPIAFLVFAAMAFVGAIVALLLFWSKPAQAQGNTGQSAYVLMQGADTIMVERITRSSSNLRGDLSVRGGPRMTYSADIDTSGAVPFMTMRIYAPNAAPDALPAQSAAARIGADSVIIELIVGGQARRLPSAMTGQPIPYLNVSFALCDLMVARARKAGGSYAGKFVLLQTTAIPLDTKVEFVGRDSVTFTLAGVGVRAALDADGHISGATIPAQGIIAVRVTGAAAANISLGRTDYGAPPGAPYTAEEVSVRTPAGHSLSGTLTIPKGANGKLPAVVTITGSGQEDRDEYIPLVPNYRPFRQLADTLGRRGIAVLRLDDRGINGSGGEVRSATSADFADDIRAGVAFLRSRTEIDPARIALFGHSEGGLIGPMVAATDTKLAGIVIFAGPAYTGRTIIDFQLRNLVMGDSAIPAAKKDSAVRAKFAAWDSTSGKAPWTKFFLDYDPLPALRKVKSPVLILQGGTDQQVTPDQAPIIERTLKAAGNKDVTLRVFPNRNHLFLPDSIGFPGNYTKLKDGRIGADVFGPLTDWLVLKLSATRSRP